MSGRALIPCAQRADVCAGIALWKENRSCEKVLSPCHGPFEWPLDACGFRKIQGSKDYAAAICSLMMVLSLSSLAPVISATLG